ncbi:MAG: hypothetical protein ACI37O_06250 [Candidatus Avelusimicrobium sp.]|uniref:hypothetical protein n=1 Tax=Candidatus Avelusimicrobium sp. TaxID=3048833 RepID=UPI003F0AF8CF
MAVKSTEKGITAWIKKENARMSAPLRRGQAPGTGDVISGRSPIHNLADIIQKIKSVTKITLGNAELPLKEVKEVTKITPEHAALALKEVVQPTQGSKDSIDNNAPKNKGITWAQTLDEAADNSGAYALIDEAALPSLHNAVLRTNAASKSAEVPGTLTQAVIIGNNIPLDSMKTKEDIAKAQAFNQKKKPRHRA